MPRLVTITPCGWTGPPMAPPGQLGTRPGIRHRVWAQEQGLGPPSSGQDPLGLQRPGSLGFWLRGPGTVSTNKSPSSSPGRPAAVGVVRGGSDRGPTHGVQGDTTPGGPALAEALTCPGKGGRLPVHATWPWFSCREIWDMFWPVEEEDWMSFTPGTCTTEELGEKETHVSPGDAPPTPWSP